MGNYDTWKATPPEERWVDRDRTTAAQIDLPADHCAIDTNHAGPFRSHPDRPLLCEACARVADAIEITRRARQAERRVS
jgi:hypothetical protein